MGVIEREKLEYIAESNGTLGRWLSIVGIGEDGREGLSPAANKLIDDAALIIGGARHLSLVGHVSGETLIWSSPFRDTLPLILERRGQPVCVIASGDPFWFGAGSALAEKIDPSEMLVIPAPSTFSLAAARLGWPLQSVVTLGLHSKRTECLLRHLHDRQRLLLLSLDGSTPSELAQLLVKHGFGNSRLSVFEALGGPREQVHDGLAREFFDKIFAPLNIIALKVKAGPNARAIPYSAGLPDAYFEHDGQITKREIRAITLSALRPGADELLWDVGLGSGSVAIEWLLSHPANRAIGFEKSPDRAALAMRNAAVLGVPQLQVCEGEAPNGFASVPMPDAIFVGGGLSAPGMAKACWEALRPGGRMVCNAVTFAGQAVLMDCRKRWGGQIIRIGVEREHRMGAHTAWFPAIPVVQWSGVKS